MQDLKFLLNKYWGHTDFRPMQEDIINSVLSGSDTLAILPTGGGKSICYQLPALTKEGFCLVISPLIALMQDQVQKLQEKGIPVEFLQSGMSQKQIHFILNNAVEGVYKLLYVSPERLLSNTFLEYARDFNLSLIAVDEAHCISQWGHDFRPAYRKIHEIRPLFKNVPILALTATATKRVKLDIAQQLELKNPQLFVQTVIRNNLFYNVRYTENKVGDIKSILTSVKGSGILYCRSRKRCVDLAVALKNEEIDASFYHAGLQRHQRKIIQETWMQSHSQVIAATTAFGMGIDKPDVRTVTHFDVPHSLEEYYQEAGRAGRDGKKAFSVLLYHQSDLELLQLSTENNFPPIALIKKVYKNVCDYLKIPVESGKEQLYPFDALKFMHNFKLELFKTLSAIKILEREGFWIWNEDTKTQAVVQFTSRQEDLNYLEKHDPHLAQITLGLLRLHGSIFHYPTPIKMFDTAKLLRLDYATLKTGLEQLSRLGIIDYQPAIHGSTLLLLEDRVRNEYLYLDEKHIANLREAHEERVSAIVTFMENKEECRNVQLACYFDEQVDVPCGSCDVCKSRKGGHVLKADLYERVQLILKKQESLSIQELTSHFQVYEKKIIIDIVRELTDEGLCLLDSKGNISKK